MANPFTTVKIRMSEEEYRALPGLRASDIKRALKSGEAWLKVPQRATGPMTLGNAAHCAIMTPDEFESRYASMPDLNLRTNDGKAARDAFLLDCEGRGVTVLDRDDWATIPQMVAAARAHAEAYQLLMCGDHEVAIQWKEGPYQCKAKLDCLSTDGRELREYKTVGKGELDDYQIRGLLEKEGHGIQVAHYARAVRAEWGFTPVIKLVYQLTCPPFTLRPITLFASALDVFEVQLDKALSRIWAIKDAGPKWLDYPHADMFDISPWAYREAFPQEGI